MSDLVNSVALEMFRVDQKISFGRNKSDADANWRSMGPDGRKKWRAMSMTALQMLEAAPATVKSTAAVTKTAPKPAQRSTSLATAGRYRP